MENVAVSRRNHTYKKGNKENAQPEYGSKSSVRRDKTSATPFQLTNNKMEETSVKKGPLKAKVDTRWTSGEALKTTGQRDGRGAAAAAVKQRQTHSRAFFTEHSVKHKVVPQAPKPPAAVASSKPAPGTYKGKIVQSKIGSIWKVTVAVGVPDPKPSALKTEGQKVGNVTKSRSKSVADLPGCGTRQPVSKRSKSVLDRPAQVTKSAVTSRPPAGSRSARPPARTVLSTRATSSSRDPKVAPAKGVGTLNSKPKIPVTDKPVSSGLSQYRFTMETAEERSGKLAEWLASKGKALKRPAMKTAEPSKTKGSIKPKADLNPHPQSPAQPAAQCNAESEPRLESQKLDAAAHRADTQGAELATAVIMNTTLDLLENSDVDLSGSVDDIVVNLCDALEAMETPSRCDELSQDVCSGVEKDSEPKNDGEKEMKNEMPEEVGKQPEVEQVKDVESEEMDEEGVRGGECVTENRPQMEDASVIKYSVKTTPYLQSVKKTMKEDASASRSGRKRNINDLKFLTPVRRSCRIERQSSRLPTMLVDPDPCVSSLAELLQLDDDPSAYICRKNPALLEDLPDCKELLRRQQDI